MLKGERMKDKLILFFKLRKQSDTVKMICIFVLAGAACFANVIAHAWEIYRVINTPAEYVLTGEGRISGKRMEEMRQKKSVARVSRQMECPVTVLCGGREATVSCTLLSAEYLEEMFQTDLSAGTKKIFMNQTAFSDLKEQIWENDREMEELEKGEGDGVTELNIRYSVEEPALSQGEDAPAKYQLAKLIVVGKGGEEEEGAVYMAASDSQLLKEADGMRVQFAKHDLDGLQVRALRNLGYEIQNEETVITEEYELKTKLLHIKYGLLSCGLCVLAAFVLR